MKARAEKLVVVGTGMAAGRLVERLEAEGYRGEITLVGEEPLAGYNRVLLPGLVAGTCSTETLTTHPPAWFRARGIRTLLGSRVQQIDLASRAVRLADHSQLDFDRLVLATGATVPMPDIAGTDLIGVTTLRNLEDARRLRALAAQPGPAVVVGGGLLGLETAHSLVQLGADVHVLHRNARLLNRQVDETAAAMLTGAMEARGIRVHLGSTPVAILGRSRVRAVRTCSGETLPADIVVFATGTRCNDSLAAAAGLECAAGVLVDARLQTSHPAVFAMGECARVCGATYTLVEPVFRQADVLARVLGGREAAFVPPPPATHLKVSGIELYSAGEIDAGSGDDIDQVCVRDPRRGLYRSLTFRRRRLVGAVLLGDIAGSPRIQSLITGATDVPADPGIRTEIAFGLTAVSGS